MIHPYKGVVFNHNKECAIKARKKHGRILHAYGCVKGAGLKELRSVQFQGQNILEETAFQG